MLDSGRYAVVPTRFPLSKEAQEYAAVLAELQALQASLPKPRLTAKQVKAAAKALKAQFKADAFRRNRLGSSLWRMAQA